MRSRPLTHRCFTVIVTDEHSLCLIFSLFLPYSRLHLSLCWFKTKTKSVIFFLVYFDAVGVVVFVAFRTSIPSSRLWANENILLCCVYAAAAVVVFVVAVVVWHYFFSFHSMWNEPLAAAYRKRGDETIFGFHISYQRPPNNKYVYLRCTRARVCVCVVISTTGYTSYTI